MTVTLLLPAPALVFPTGESGWEKQQRWRRLRKLLKRDIPHPQIWDIKLHIPNIPTEADARCNGEEREEATEAKVQTE